MKYNIISNIQLFVLAVLIGLFSATAVVLNSMYQSYVLLPTVVLNETGMCLKVVNYENGHAFACPDVDVTLRRYRKQIGDKVEKVLETQVHDVQADKGSVN